jgi:hypothetical protein
MATAPISDRFTVLVHHQYRSNEGLWVTHHTDSCGPFGDEEKALAWAEQVATDKDLLTVQRDRGDGTQPFVIYYKAGHPQRSIIEAVRLIHPKGNITKTRQRVVTWLTATRALRRTA